MLCTYFMYYYFFKPINKPLSPEKTKTWIWPFTDFSTNLMVYALLLFPFNVVSGIANVPRSWFDKLYEDICMAWPGLTYCLLSCEVKKITTLFDQTVAKYYMWDTNTELSSFKEIKCYLIKVYAYKLYSMRLHLICPYLIVFHSH